MSKKKKKPIYGSIPTETQKLLLDRKASEITNNTGVYEDYCMLA